MTPTLYQRIVAAGIPHASHESDLHVPFTNQVLGIIKECDYEACMQSKSFTRIHRSLFFNQVERAMWLDIPFAYDPWWEARLKK